MFIKIILNIFKNTTTFGLSKYSSFGIPIPKLEYSAPSIFIKLFSLITALKFPINIKKIIVGTFMVKFLLSINHVKLLYII